MRCIMFGLGPAELIIIAVIILLLFGAKRLPEIGKGLGGAVKEVKKMKREISRKDDDNDPSGNSPSPKEEASPSLETKVVDKVLEQVPGVKKAVDIKKKAKKVKEFLE